MVPLYLCIRLCYRSSLVVVVGVLVAAGSFSSFPLVGRTVAAATEPPTTMNSKSSKATKWEGTGTGEGFGVGISELRAVAGVSAVAIAKKVKLSRTPH